MPARRLSGGERNRLLLAKLFLQPANLLVLDEPTNDLDAETLELLEELLSGYDGTLLLVSHDRVFLDQVVTGALVFEGEGRVSEYVGGYEDWMRQRPPPPESSPKPRPNQQPPAKTKNERPRKFLNRERRELEGLPAQIEALEGQRHHLTEKLNDPALYHPKQGQAETASAVAQIQTDIVALDDRIRQAYSRWEELEAIQQSCEPQPNPTSATGECQFA
jgi:ATP-binding cassette subfamily F protein uup